MTVCECFSDDQLRSFQRAFSHYDKEKTGVLNLDDLQKALKIIGIVPTQEELNGMKIDLGNAPLDILEFISLIYYFLRGSDTQEELIRAFAVFDEDNDGKIPAETAEQILSNLKHPVPKDHIEEVLAQIGADENGLIDYAEMIRVLKPE
ncbi:EF hand family protein [Tritrichomonas foetus]|uniref:EF hand family protein n=1 Tax=Tritrichomonas foetus TaxID=1144522 RepID=A0A1J4JUR2_9EUKA|nr:EF hand family protein [Tritrichomonas foetus]|eukprot:OHT02450.1 EF hand family protein [Tritrichomonas foetus]